MFTINTIKEKKAYSNFRYNRMAAILKMAAKGEWGKILRGSLSQNCSEYITLHVYQFWCFYEKVNNSPKISLYAAAL